MTGKSDLILEGYMLKVEGHVTYGNFITVGIPYLRWAQHVFETDEIGLSRALKDSLLLIESERRWSEKALGREGTIVVLNDCAGH